MSSRRTHATLVACALLLLPAAVRAQDADRPRFVFNGFGTLGVVHSSEDRADFTANGLRPEGPGYSDELSFDVDSRLGAQVTFSATSQLSATVQVVGEQRYDDRYTPRLEWANVRYAITPELAVRLGRTALPVFMVSDFRKVGYANPWVRPPVELYRLVPVFTSDGVDASYRLRLGRWTNTTQALFSRSDYRLPNGAGTAEARDVWGVFNTIERAALTARFGIASGRLTTDSANVFLDLFRSFGAEGAAIADRYELDGDRVTFAGVGAGYDPGAWFITGEVGRIVSDSYVGRSTAWYVSGGPRLGRVTPHLTYSGVDVTSERSAPGLDVTALPPELAELAAGLNAGLNGILGSKPIQQTVSIGGRWDFMRNVALKLQLDRIDVGEGSPGTFTNQQPDFEQGGTAHLFSASTVFVF